MYIAMATEVLEQLDLSQSALGQNLLAEDVGNLLHRDTLASLDVGGSTGGGQPSQFGAPTRKTRRAHQETYHTMPYAPWPSSLVTL